MGSEILSLEKVAHVLNVIVGERVTFSIYVRNISNVDIKNVIISDILSPELEFIDGSIKIEGKKYSENYNIVSGINIREIRFNESVVITFDAMVLSKTKDSILRTFCNAEFEYLNNKNNLIIDTVISEEIFIYVESAEIEIVKTSNRKNLSVSDEVEVLIELKNTGTVDTRNIMLKEFIDETFEIIPNSFIIDGKKINNVNLSYGLIVGDLNVNEIKKVYYKFKYRRSIGKNAATNTTNIDFYYCQNGILIKNVREIYESIDFELNMCNFKSISISNKIFREGDNLPIQMINNFLFDVEIKNYYVINTAKGFSNEGAILTGNKLLVKGIINQCIEYTSTKNLNIVYSILASVPFSAFIALPDDFKNGDRVTVEYEIEDTSCKKRSEDSVYTSISLLIVVKCKPYII